VLAADQTVGHGRRVADELMKELRIDPGDLLEQAHVDLLPPSSNQGSQ